MTAKANKKPAPVTPCVRRDEIAPPANARTMRPYIFGEE